MPKLSAGILLYRKAGNGYEVLLVHPGGPFWAKKDNGAWSIPKGEFAQGEDTFIAAKREFEEEVGAPPPTGDYQPLGEFKQPSGKIVHAYMLASDFDLEKFTCNMFEMEWPPKSGKMQEFPENDKAAWMSLAKATQKLVKGQVPIIDRLATHLGVAIGAPEPTAEPPQTSLF